MCVSVSVCNERSILEAENQNKLKKQKQKPSRQRRATTCRDLETWNKHFLYPQCEQQKTFPCDAATGIRISSAAPTACPQLTWLTVWQLLAGLLAAPLPGAAHNSGSVQHSLSGDLHFITSWSSFPPHFSVHFMHRTACPSPSLSPALHRDSLIIMSKSHCECFKGNN